MDSYEVVFKCLKTSKIASVSITKWIIYNQYVGLSEWVMEYASSGAGNVPGIEYQRYYMEFWYGKSKGFACQLGNVMWICFFLSEWTETFISPYQIGRFYLILLLWLYFFLNTWVTKEALKEGLNFGGKMIRCNNLCSSVLLHPVTSGAEDLQSI